MTRTTKNENQTSIEEIENLLKPKLSTVILGTLICSAPFGHVILGIIEKDFDNLLKPALLTFPTLIIMGFTWFWYLNGVRTYKKEAKNLYDEFNKE